MVEEHPGKFYLGRVYDLEGGALLEEPILYDADDLTTHAVCIGMTGSGKTGLGIGLLEEAILQGLPLLVVDPKGDVTNLLLTFPELRPEDFQPWVDPAKAQRDGLSVAEYAGKIAARWRKGLGEWGIEPEHIQRLRQAADFVIYTPGSDAGQPLSILQSFRAPEGGWDAAEEEETREQITSLVSALLNLVDVEADPLRSREHILLSNLVEHAWRAGQDLDLPALIQGVQKPPFRKLGVFDVDAFFPPDDRFKLAVLFNGLIASPTFRAWTEGSAVDIKRFLWTPDGRPQVSIFYLAHMNDAERMFFVTLLLEAVRGWLRGESGSASLRAILYFDELLGYFPPHPGNPPSKEPLMALLKQARAYGLGLMLTTQNPVDLDYKGLTNAGTWFIGTLQADRDKQRLLDGLEGVAAGSLSRAYLDKVISSLRSRVFLLHNVHEKAPKIFNTRWVMSYLRGPLTRDEVRRLKTERAFGEAAVEDAPSAAEAPGPAPTPSVRPTPEGLYESPPTLPPEVQQFFLRASRSPEEAARDWKAAEHRQVQVTGSRLLYRPGLLGLGEVYFEDTRKDVEHREEVALVAMETGGGATVWADAEPWPISGQDLEGRPAGEALYEAVPEAFNEPREFRSLERAFVDHLYRTSRLEIPYNRTLKLYGRAGESDRDFRERCEKAARKGREEELEKAREKFEARREKLERKLQKEEMELAEDRSEHEGRKRDEILSAGESVLGMLFGRRSSRAVSAASRRRRMTQKAQMDVKESEETIKDLKEDLEELQREEEDALEEIRDEWVETLEEMEMVAIKPLKRNVRALTFGLMWVPHWAVTYRDELAGSTGTVVLPAFAVKQG